ncbi:MAG: regulatory protein RecX [bacterium]|nr:regulatory protein RecX [bacterium]
MRGFPKRGTGSRGDAYRDALHALSRRPLTEEEVRKRLAAAGHDAASVESTLDRLRDAGYVGDEKLAVHFIAARSERLRLGPQRLLRDLERRGVAAEVARRALQLATDEHGIDSESTLRAEVRRRLGEPPGPVEMKTMRRVYNALLRGGFDAEAIRSQLSGYRFPEGSDDEVF